jgi:hypothetical protein
VARRALLIFVLGLGWVGGEGLAGGGDGEDGDLGGVRAEDGSLAEGSGEGKGVAGEEGEGEEGGGHTETVVNASPTTRQICVQS